MSNNDCIVQGFNKLLPVASHFVIKSLKDHFGQDWWKITVIKTLRDVQKRDLPICDEEGYLISKLDIARVFLLMDLHWKEVFNDMASHEPPGLTYDCRTWAREFQSIVTNLPHIGLDDFSKRDALRTIDTMMRSASTSPLRLPRNSAGSTMRSRVHQHPNRE